MVLLNLDDIDEPLPLPLFQGRLFDGKVFNGIGNFIVDIYNGGIKKIIRSEKNDGILEFPESMLILPGGIYFHCHGREVFDILPEEEGDQTYKEDSYSLSLALAQGGATHGVCMPNLSRFIEDEESYAKQLEWINSKHNHRRKPIMPLSMYALIRPNSHPRIKKAIWKVLWNTFGPTNFDNDEQVIPTLENYIGQFKTVHCETISGIVKDNKLPWHEQRPKKAGLDAVKMMCDFSLKYNSRVNIAHISSWEEMDMVNTYKARGAPLSFELTPQAITLNYDTFESQTGYPIVYLRQNPPIRDINNMLEMRKRMKKTDILAGDHAPHTINEKENGISGMPQASTEGQLYLERVSTRDISLKDYIEKRCHTPGKILEDNLGQKVGRIKEGYEASFAIVSMGKTSRIRNNEVLSKCAWTPYNKYLFLNTIEGVVIRGVLYTQKALQKLK